MRLVTPGKILFFVLLFLPAEQFFTQSTSPATESSHFLSAKISISEFVRRLAPWESKHPDLATKVITTRLQLQGDVQVSRIFRMTYPTLDIYSSAGVPLYFSDSSEVNVKVIDALPQVIPEPDLNPRYKVRPSLREALSMIPGIPRSDRATPAQIDYTIFVVSLDPPDVNASQAQKKAIQQQKKRAIDPRIQVTEVPSAHPDLDLDAARRNALANQAQDEAIQRLKTRLNGSRIRVIEIRLEQ
ncbi:MAG: hypothetical protein WBD67_07275 [Terracidiphilus sp.]